MLLFSGEGKDVTREMIDPWKETTLQTILTNYAKTDIYNAEEFGLFFKALPKETLHQKPSCFKNIKKLPCRYRGQNKSWMD